MRKFYKWLWYTLLAFTVSIIVVFLVAYIKRNEIQQLIVAEFNERVNGTFAVDKIQFTIFHHFPDFSITLQKVTLHDTTNQQPVLSVNKIYLDIGLYALFRKEINITALSLDDGSVFLYRDINGYSNTSVFKLKKNNSDASNSSSQNYSLNLNSVSFKNVAFSYIDSIKQKRVIFKLLDIRHTLARLEDYAEVNMIGKMHCHELTFNTKAGGFLEEKSFTANLHLRYYDTTKQLLILPSSLEIANDEILVEGSFLLNNEAKYSLHIETKSTLFSNGLSYVNDRIQSKLEKFIIDKPIHIDVRLHGKHNDGKDPQADVHFSSEKVNFAFEKLRIKNVTCSGRYLHRPDSIQKNLDHSSIDIDSFRGKIEGVPVEGKVTFTNLFEPVIDLSMKSKVTHLTFNNLVDTTEWVSKSGSFVSSIKYKGKLEEYLDSTRSKYYGKLAGNFKAHDGIFLYKPKNIILKNVNALFSFTENKFSIDSLSLDFNSSQVSIKGSIKNYIPFFIQPANKGYVQLDLISPNLDLSSIASVQDENIKKTETQQLSERKKLTSVLNTIQRKLQFDIAVYAAAFTYKKFKAQEIKGKVILDGDKLETSNIKMKVANGDMSAKLTFVHDDTSRRQLSLTSVISGADIREFFTLFNNFGQTTISANNLAGSISATTNFAADVQKDFSIDPTTMRGNISCTIREGQLINFEPLENISKFLFRKRDFSDVHFAELDSYFNINGTNLDIDRMEVQSNVLSFFLQGRYSFTDSTSLSLQIPLSNLKKRDKNYMPENKGIHSKTGMSVYLHIFRDRDINSKINIAYDPFKKWVKKR